MSEAPNLQRWADRRRSAAEDDRAAALFREAPLPEPSAAMLGRVEARLRARESRRTRPWAARVAWRAATVAALLLLGLPVCIAVASPGGAFRKMLDGVIQTVRGQRERPAVAPPRVRAPSAIPRVVVAATPSSPELAPPPPSQPRQAPRVPTPTPAPVPSAAPRSTASEEAAALDAALQQLRPGGSAALALERVRSYRQRFPDGLFGSEATLAELQAYLALERYPEALGLFDRFEASGFANLPHPEELRLSRAETLAKLGRCQEAASGFSAILARPGAASLRERAAFGEAVCAEQLGKTDESRLALQRYLERYPSGRFSADARRALGQSR